MTAPPETPPETSTSTRGFWKRSALAIGGVILFHAFFDIPGFFYENRGWDIPSNPVEKAAYDYAHSLKLPDSVPQEAPYFPFWWARIVALIPGAPSVDEAYFRHLCEHEAGDYVFKRVENVEGVFQLRPREVIYGMPIDYDRYRLEEPTGVGAGDDDSFAWGRIASFVQPMGGLYEFLELPSLEHEGAVVRYVRGRNDNPPDGYRNGVQAYSKEYDLHRIPFVVVREEDRQRRARYGFTWRGIKRANDRRYSIGAGEYLIVDLDTNEVLAVKRAFKISGKVKDTKSGIWWGNALWCKGKEWEYRYLVREVLKPVRSQ
jgi:hypothetical protein